MIVEKHMDILFRLLANTADGAFVIDEEQRVIFWNQAAEEILGYKAEEILGRACHEILGGCDEKGRAICSLHCSVSTAALSGQEVSHYDVMAQARSGQRRWINVSILVAPSPDSHDGAMIVHLFRDATLAKQNEQFVKNTLSAVEQLQQSAGPVIPPRPAKTSTETLTEREQQVLSLLAQGLRTNDIAQELSISTSTVRNHVQNILNKLQVHSRLEAVAYAFEHGLIDRE